MFAVITVLAVGYHELPVTAQVGRLEKPEKEGMLEETEYCRHLELELPVREAITDVVIFQLMLRRGFLPDKDLGNGDTSRQS